MFASVLYLNFLIILFIGSAKNMNTFFIDATYMRNHLINYDAFPICYRTDTSRNVKWIPTILQFSFERKQGHRALNKRKRNSGILNKFRLEVWTYSLFIPEILIIFPFQFWWAYVYNQPKNQACWASNGVGLVSKKALKDLNHLVRSLAVPKMKVWIKNVRIEKSGYGVLPLLSLHITK